MKKLTLFFISIFLAGSSFPGTVDISSDGNGVLTYSASGGGGGGAPAEMDAFLLLPENANVPTTNPGIPDLGSNQHSILYDDTTDESNSWTNLILNNYQSGTVTADIFYSMASATTAEVIFCVQVWAISDGDAVDTDTESYDTANCTAATTVPGTAGYVDKISLTLSNVDSMADGDLVAIKVYRDADAAGDDASGDAELRSVLIHE